MRSRGDSLKIMTIQLCLGSDDTEAITAIGMSPSGRYVFICERAPEGEKGKFSIIDTVSRKKKKTLPESID